nr:hypothetical protein BaRGS_014121 [Batillaria attramentaria]
MTTLDSVIEALGGMGRFQFLSMIIVNGPRMLIGWSMLHMSYVGVTPDWWCVTSGSNLTLAKEDNSTFEECSVNGSECPKPVFDSSMSTVVSEWGLVCDRAVIRPTIISIQFAGILVGAFLTGQISDLFGRRYTFFAGLTLHGIFNVASSFSVAWEMFAALRFFIGMCIGCFFVIEIPYCIEFQPKRWRSVTASLPTWNVGISFMVLAAWLVEDWSKLHLILGVLHVPFVLGFFVLPESVRWLAVSGRLEESEAVVEKIARINKKTKPSTCRQILEDVAAEEQESKKEQQKHSYLDIFRGWKIARATILLLFIWVSMSVSYYGISFGVVGLSGDIYLNIFLLNIVGSPVVFLTFWLANKFGRRYPTAILFFISAVGGLANIAIVLKVPEDSQGTAILVLCLIARVGLECAWAIVVTHTNELYPTSIRNLGYGAANTLTRVGGIIAPYVIDFEVIPIVSYVVIGATMGLSGVAVLLLDDTKDKALPDTILSSGFTADKTEKEKAADNGLATIQNGGEPITTNGSLGKGEFYSTHL